MSSGSGRVILEKPQFHYCFLLQGGSIAPPWELLKNESQGLSQSICAAKKEILTTLSWAPKWVGVKVGLKLLNSRAPRADLSYEWKTWEFGVGGAWGGELEEVGEGWEKAPSGIRQVNWGGKKWEISGVGITEFEERGSIIWDFSWLCDIEWNPFLRKVLMCFAALRLGK